MIEIPSGTFLMGGIAEDKFVTAVELPQVEVALDRSFALGMTPVTQAEWLSVMGAHPAGRSNDSGAGDCPVVGVHFEAVREYLETLSGLVGQSCRLPTEVEWEYACRAGSTTIFPGGLRLDLGDANFLYDESGTAVGKGALTPVGEFPPNAFGLHDMLGNVCEWTADIWQMSHRGATAGALGQDVSSGSQRRTIRGGGWDHLPRVLRPSWRDWAPEDARWDNLGFRVAHEL